MTFDLNMYEYTYPLGGESSWAILNCIDQFVCTHIWEFMLNLSTLAT